MIKDLQTDKPEKNSGLTLSKVAQINKLAPSGLKFFLRRSPLIAHYLFIV
jgi:hypothetical protein